MATYTENYGLHQWEANDNFLREDFNTDLAKIDGALGALDSGLATLENVVEAKKIAVGSYTGNDGTQTFELGFKPIAVLVFNRRIDVNDGYLAGMALQDLSAHQINGNTVLNLTDTGFTAIQCTGASLNSSYYTYNYLAIG